ncbi:hypothetical protein J0910_30330 [Nocardiopsis sp. CNT-189]|uniref:hypothetical protein n=1 Tax=Nocardiopsis oceanisediminis TaxID=2816862 RepID=UPI003B35933C
MVKVAIQPSFGNAAARQHWKDTLDEEVDFTSGHRRQALTAQEYALLEQAHPQGRARFWGATKAQDKNMQRLGPGDVVLFTGKKQVRGVGEIGVRFRSAAFAETLWDPDPKNGAWLNVYSLSSFTPLAIPYEEVWALPGFNHGDNFMGLRVLDEERARTVLDGLGITPEGHLRSLIDQEAHVEEELLASLAGSQAVPLEAVHTPATSYERAAGGITVRRTEALLVQEFASTLEGVEVQRLRTPAGVTDVYLSGPQGGELIEAKSGSTRSYVRQALAQLLDYAAHTDRPVDRVWGLFPREPAADLVKLLHRYGIGCIYRTAPKQFVRLAPPEDSQELIVQFW